uniref:DNA topoisomerase (ATP-hydrolyzing) n=1 Tax=Nothobranchius pienaari TaxID=704102 RepID=A0A1A8NHA7_9TELE
MSSSGAHIFSEIDKLRVRQLNNIEMTSGQSVFADRELSQTEILNQIEGVILRIVTSLSKDEAPALVVPNRSSWANVSFNDAIGLQMSSEHCVTTIRSDCPSSATKSAQILKILSVIYTLVQSNSYATKRDIFYSNTQLFSSQKSLDAIIDDISCMLKLPRRSLHVLATSKGLISGDLCYLEADGTRIDCRSTSAAVSVSSNISGITSIEIMCIYKYGSVAMSFEARSLTVPSVMWLGLLPSDLQRDSLIPLTKRDESKLNSLLKRPYVASQPDWQKEMELMQQSQVKAEIQSLASIAPDFLTNIYLPNKLRYGGWV